MQQLPENLKNILNLIRQSEQKFGRIDGSVKLLAVSKTQSIENIRLALQAGQIYFGESYIQEAVEKIEQFSSNQDIEKKQPEWHFIGPVQSNKTKQIAINFNWVHSVDRIKIAQRLNDQRPENLPPLQVCLQVNTSSEQTKSGCKLEELKQLADEIQACSRLQLRGLMTIPARVDDAEQQRLPFRILKTAMDQLNQSGFQLDTLSMGMSNDMEAAIAEGSTIVRIGTALFGPREY